jgi:FkbM family methyltransferase
MKKYTIKLKLFFHIPLNNRDYNYLSLKKLKSSSYCDEIRIQDNEVKFLYRKTIAVYGRVHPHSDLLVINNVLILNDYSVVVDFFKDNLNEKINLKIVDAGANIGSASIYFKAFFPAAQIACIEPDTENLKMLHKNLDSFIKNNTVFVYKNALMDQPNKSILLKKNFRDSKDWSISTEESNIETTLRSVTIQEIMVDHGWDQIDILKIDIEGSERFLFKESANTDFLNYVKVVAIEIHDEFNIREHIYSVLKKYSFVLFNYGEITLGVNKALLNEINV